MTAILNLLQLEMHQQCARGLTPSQLGRSIGYLFEVRERVPTGIKGIDILERDVYMWRIGRNLARFVWVRIEEPYFARLLINAVRTFELAINFFLAVLFL